MTITRESLDLASEDKDFYREHKDELVQINTGHNVFIGKYFGTREKTREIVLFPSLSWDVNGDNEPILAMNHERPRYLSLHAIDNIGPVSERYVKFYVDENLRQFREGKSKSNK